jgi:hypothetical protein
VEHGDFGKKQQWPKLLQQKKDAELIPEEKRGLRFHPVRNASFFPDR